MTEPAPAGAQNPRTHCCGDALRTLVNPSPHSMPIVQRAPGPTPTSHPAARLAPPSRCTCTRSEPGGGKPRQRAVHYDDTRGGSCIFGRSAIVTCEGASGTWLAATTVTTHTRQPRGVRGWDATERRISLPPPPYRARAAITVALRTVALNADAAVDRGAAAATVNIARLAAVRVRGCPAPVCTRAVAWMVRTAIHGPAIQKLAAPLAHRLQCIPSSHEAHQPSAALGGRCDTQSHPSLLYPRGGGTQRFPVSGVPRGPPTALGAGVQSTLWTGR